MNWFKGVALVLAISPIGVVSGFVSVASAGSLASGAATANIVAIKDGDTSSDADKRAKAIECSKQADAKHLHGDARLKFRAACKDKSST